MNIKLSNRLLAVAKQVDKDARVADIGTDHGYLAVYLTINNISDYVIAFGKAIKALEKQIPRKVIFGYDEQDDIYCPVCKFSLAIVDDHEYESTFYKYCPRGSQKLDWGDIV